MKVRRIVANIDGKELDKAETFYGKFLGLDVLMDHGWIKTFGSSEKMVLQLSVASEGGSGTAVPDLSIEVDDLSGALEKARQLGLPIEYGPVNEPWGGAALLYPRPVWQTRQRSAAPVTGRRACIRPINPAHAAPGSPISGVGPGTRQLHPADAPRAPPIPDARHTTEANDDTSSR